MLEASCRLRFAAKALGEPRLAQHLGMQHFDRDGIADVQPRRAIDGRHPARPEPAVDTILLVEHTSEQRIANHDCSAGIYSPNLVHSRIWEGPSRARAVRRGMYLVRPFGHTRPPPPTTTCQRPFERSSILV